MSCLCDLTEFQTVIGNIDIHGDSERGTPRMGGREWALGIGSVWLEISLILRRRYEGSKFKEVSSRLMISLEC